MANSDEPTEKKFVGIPPKAPPAPADVENQTPPSLGVGSIVKRWRREDLLKKGSWILRAMAFIFSLLSFIIMASNKHGYWMDFDKYEEYRYVLAIAIISTFYTAGQILYKIYQQKKGKALFSERTTGFVDFFGDQVMAYLLISAASAAIPSTNQIRKSSDNIFSDSSAASISMAFLAFMALALSAMISGFKLSNQTYI